MKHSIKTLLLTLTVTLAISHTAANAQFKFGGKSSSKSGSSSSSQQSSSRGSSRFSSSKGSQSFGGFSSRGQSSHTSQPSSKGSQNHGGLSSGKTPSKGGFTFGGFSSKKPNHSFNNHSSSKQQWNGNHKVDTKDIKLPWTNQGTTSGKVIPGKGHVQLGHWGLGGQHKIPHQTQQATQHHKWQGVAKHLIHSNFHSTHWCQKRPAVCQWWNNYCTPIANCQQHEVVVCNWHHITCAPIVQAGVQVQPVQWYLGMKGILLPGKGIGIDAVEPGSPAELVGLQPGMVLVNCNGIDMVDEAAMQQAVATSGGVLKMTLLSADGGQTLEGVVQMTQVAAVSF